jgi:hypothetical protein
MFYKNPAFRQADYHSTLILMDFFLNEIMIELSNRNGLDHANCLMIFAVYCCYILEKLSLLMNSSCLVIKEIKKIEKL